MKKSFYLSYIILTLFLFFSFSCNESSDVLSPKINGIKIVDSIYTGNYNITCIGFDNHNGVWLGTNNSGVIYYNQKYQKHFPPEEVKTYGNINAIVTDKDNNVWIAADGLIKYDGNSFTRYDVSNSPLFVNSVTHLCIDDDNNLWLSSFYNWRKGGVICKKGDIWRTYDVNNSPLISSNIQDIVKDDENNIWIALQKSSYWTSSLMKITDSGWEEYKLDYSVAQNKVPAIKKLLPVGKKIVVGIYVENLERGMGRPDIFEWNSFSWIEKRIIEPGDKTYSWCFSFNADKDNSIWVHGYFAALGRYALVIQDENGQFILKNNFNGQVIMNTDSQNRTWLAYKNTLYAYVKE